MLEPNSRRLLMESLQPPDGHRLDWAVGTTYTLDLMALLTAPVAFAFSDWQDRDGRPTCDPLALLKAVRQYASRVCIFCQAGKIHVPKTYQPLLASLEDSIVEATAPRGGSFHPKMWFLRFVETEGQSVRYRVLCASRNMTFDRSWDTLLCLEGLLRERTNAYRTNHPLGQFVEALPRMSVRPIGSTWKRRLAELAHEIRRVEFEIPEPFEEIDFWPLGIGGDDRWPFPERIDQMFVVSPFVDDGLIRDLGEWNAPIQLLSRPDRVSFLSPETLRLIDKAWVLDDTANPEPADAEEEQQSASTANDTPNEAAGDSPLVGLHAKVYVVDEGWNARVFTGSANATQAGFNRNVEFLTELRGKKSRCGISAMLGETSDDDGKRASSLADILQPYKATETPTEHDAELEAFERNVDQFAQALAETAPVAKCEPDAMEGMFRVQLVPIKRMKKSPPVDWEVHVRPVSLQDSHLLAAVTSEPVWAEFRQLSLLGLTSFYMFDVESAKPKFKRRFVLNIPLQGVPQNRHEAILRELLSDRDRVLKFLLLLLQDSGARDLSTLMQSSNDTEGQFAFVQSLFGATLFESLIRALDRDPERLEQVAHVIRDLRSSEQGQDLLPDDLDAIWAPIWAVRMRQIERRKNQKGSNEQAADTP